MNETHIGIECSFSYPIIFQTSNSLWSPCAIWA